MTERCETCAFWDRDLPMLATGVRRPDGSDPDIGTCSIAPPAVIRSPLGGAISCFAETHKDRWCSAWLPEPDGPPDGGEVINLDERRAA